MEAYSIAHKHVKLLLRVCVNLIITADILLSVNSRSHALSARLFPPLLGCGERRRI